MAPPFLRKVQFQGNSTSVPLPALASLVNQINSTVKKLPASDGDGKVFLQQVGKPVK